MWRAAPIDTTRSTRGIDGGHPSYGSIRKRHGACRTTLRCASVRFLSISICKAPADYTATPLQKRLLRLLRLRAVIAPRRRAAFAYKRYGELICKIVDVKPAFLPLGRRTAVASPREDKPTFEEVAVLALVNSTPSAFTNHGREQPLAREISLATRSHVTRISGKADNPQAGEEGIRDSYRFYLNSTASARIYRWCDWTCKTTTFGRRNRNGLHSETRALRQPFNSPLRRS